MSEKPVLLRTEKLCKEFNQVTVLSQVDFDLHAGEIHALIGENGAGKSTFVKILSGVYQASGGRCFLEGEERVFRTARESELAGIYTIHQEINLVPYFNAYQNVFMGNEQRGRLGLLDDREMARKTKEVLTRLNISLDVKKPVARFNTSIQRIIQISSALVYNPKVLIFDEPTTALGEEERERLLEVIRGLRSRGMGIIYISHNIEEIVALCDRVTVFKDGHKAGTLNREEMDSRQIVRMMTGGQEYAAFSRQEGDGGGQELLRAEALCTAKLKGVGFSLHRGEILGVAGVTGAGKSEIARAVFGVDKLQSGRVLIKGKQVRPDSTAAVKRGLALVPEERRLQGLVSGFDVAANASLAYLDRYAKGFLLRQRLEWDNAQEHIQALSIKTTGPGQTVRTLSGGNQQKVVLSKWLSGDFDILILDEPTKGIDVMAKRDIYRLVNRLAGQGKGVLFLSSYLPELLGFCDRILVLNDGAVVQECPAHGPDAKERITHAMLGGIGK